MNVEQKNMMKIVLIKRLLNLVWVSNNDRNCSSYAQGDAALPVRFSTLRGDAPLQKRSELAPFHTTDTLPSFSGARVLAADDSIVNREVLQDVLQRLKVDVTSVANGRAALETVKCERFDLIFMDGSMPEMDGFEAARAIRAWEHQTKRAPIPVIALTSHLIGHQSEQWRVAGMTDCVTKPFTLKTIAACLRTWLPDAKMSVHDKKQEQLSEITKTELSATEAHSETLLDAETFNSLVDMQAMDCRLVDRIINLYAEHAPAALENVAVCAADGETSAVAEAAHALRSLSLNIGAKRVVALCETIEDDARSSHANLTDEQLNALRQTLDETLLELLSLKQSSTRSGRRSVRRAHVPG